MSVGVASGGASLTVSGGGQPESLVLDRQSVSASRATYAGALNVSSPDVDAALTITLVFDTPRNAVGTIAGYVVSQGVACSVNNPLAAVRIG